jgi:DNA polymerase, archaea type
VGVWRVCSGYNAPTAMPETILHNSITGEDALFGRDTTTGIVAIEPDYNEGIWVYRREGDRLWKERAPYRPWILLTEPPPMELPGAEITTLDGEGYNVLVEFGSQSLYQEGRFLLRDNHIANLTYPGGPKMALIRSGKTLFKSLTFGDIVRLQFDIETDGLSPEPEANRILLIAVADNRGHLELIEGDEPEILERFVSLIRERDPDVLEGHNVFGFDLPFILARARRHNIRLDIGRDGSEPRLGQERNYAIAAGGNSRPFVPIYIHGRHVLDTYLIVQRFDWAKQALTSYGLKECARVYGFAEADRVELPRAEMAQIYKNDPELVREYARQDVVETGKLAELITPVEFYQTQMVPDAYGQVAVTGNGEKINAIFVRAYLSAGRAVPRSQPVRPYAGGYSVVLKSGVLDRVVKADVESLYPSLMLTHRIAPTGDSLGIFLPALKELTQRRLDAKRKAADSPKDSPDALYWDGLQGSYKVLINSFYGYLGGPFNFNDYDAAEKVTELGRELVQGVAAEMEKTDSTVIEIDTDGVYFVPPESVQGEEAERNYVQQIAATLPEGIRLAFDGRFQTMLSVKTKNYVLVTYEGRKIFKGASLRSRADERYGRRFLREAVDCLLQHDFDGLGALYAKTIEDILHRRIPIEDLARRERVTENTFVSAQKQRAAKVAEGVAVGEYVMVYERADGSLGRLEDYDPNKPDENPRYYMDKLYKFAKRLEDIFGKDAFARLIPKPTAQGLPKNLQTTLDLF